MVRLSVSRPVVVAVIDRRARAAVPCALLALLFTAARPVLAQSPAAAAETSPWPRLVVSELMTDPLLLDDVAGEYVEVANVGATMVRTSELELELPSGKRAAPLIGAEAILPPCGVVLLAPQPGPGAAMIKAMRLPNRAGRLVLRWRGQVVDEVQWTGRWPWPKHKAGLALERTSASADGTLGPSWRHARAPLRRVERGSPGQVAWRCPQVASATAARPTPAPVAAVAPRQSTGSRPRARKTARSSALRSKATQRRAHSEWRLWEPMATLYVAATSSSGGTATTPSEGAAVASLR